MFSKLQEIQSPAHPHKISIQLIAKAKDLLFHIVIMISSNSYSRLSAPTPTTTSERMRHPAAATPTIPIYSTALPLMRLLLLLLILIAAAPSFAQAQQQVYAYAQSPPFLRLSTSAFSLLFVTSVANPGQILVQAQPPQFQSVGDGACQDCSGGGNGGEYDKISFRHGTNDVTITSVDDCERLCTACAVEVSSGNPNRVFRGFTYVDQVNPQRCSCYFDDDIVAFTTECQNIVATCASTGESPFVYTSFRAGTGEICTSSGNTFSECFKLTAPFVASDHAPTGCPSMVPSTSPSSTPSAVPSDVPSDTPSTSPSSNPSSMPSVSLIPSESPSATPSTSSNPTLMPSESLIPSDSPSITPSTLPSRSPIETPSTSPSSNPSSIPSRSPSLSPSTKPSRSPSDTPSTSPSSTPSSIPSESRLPSRSPSETPSTSPSSIPSSIPSGSPSISPSTIPSESPSDTPSASPSLSPSTFPSDDPSSTPSEQPSVSLAPSETLSDPPSNQPSDLPSIEPSSQQSLAPFCSPSHSPTEPPLVQVQDYINLFYPDYVNSGVTCRNDGDHPDYMEINPTQWLSSSLDACCKKFFGGYLYKQCIGAWPPNADDCDEMLYYPDWNGANEGCVDDGQEPLYMLGNAQYFLSNTREECCKKFYEWNYYPCIGSAPERSDDYYPDWEGSPATCKNDGNMPVHMLQVDNARWYLFSTLKECCEKHFHFDMNACMGSSGAPVAGSNEWYVEYSANTCVQDCIGPPTTCGGLVEDAWVEKFSTKQACCEAKLWYSADCLRANR